MRGRVPAEALHLMENCTKFQNIGPAHSWTVCERRGVAESKFLIYTGLEMEGSSTELTQLLNAVGNGEACVSGDLLPAVYTELRRLAAARMAREAPGHTLQATALVHEAWLRLQHAGSAPPQADPAIESEQRWKNRAHFFSAAAEAMRRILIENARRKKALRHGGGMERLDVDNIEIATPSTTQADELLVIHEALDALAAQDARKAELVKLRYFIGLSIEEAADILGISVPTAKRDWTFARAWLYKRITKQ